ncbi:MAG: Asp-tRNA(Asn)/Glu-tRNA(Gln) amidotransferase subunit GatB [bacterium]|nr:Asp-tRNA(Asn)/Glu-tRNA(Gln) amidotransferase subunit GatB [bacterium]
MTQYKTTIGLEIHVQLKTNSKMFCTTSAQYFGSEPNVHTCPVCLGLPGALPVINKEAIESAAKFALGLHCHVSDVSKFDRKNYFYPDLPKGFQISQLDLPIGKNGWLVVEGKKIRINRAHLEEDTGKLIHAKVDGKSVSLVDFNRSGVPLMEVVSEPDIDSPDLARSYAKVVHQLARYLDVSNADMEKAGMRFDANVSVSKEGIDKLGEKVEIKNINSFRFLEKALVFEVERQIKTLESGKQVIQETRGWVEDKAITVSQRVKETSPDYRYFPEPDLPPLVFNEADIEKLRKMLPELPDKKMDRFVLEYGLDKITAQNLTEDKNLAQWYEDGLTIYAKDDKNKAAKAKVLANWVVGELIRNLREKAININSASIEPAGLIELLRLVDSSEINQTTAKKVFTQMFSTGKTPSRIIKDEGLAQVSQEADLEELLDEVIVENESAVEDYRQGKAASLGFLLGQVMRKTGGRANPVVASKLLKEKLAHGNRN